MTGLEAEDVLGEGEGESEGEGGMRAHVRGEDEARGHVWLRREGTSYAVGFGGSSDDEEDEERRVEHGQSEGDAARGRLGRVGDRRYPPGQRVVVGDEWGVSRRW